MLFLVPDFSDGEGGALPRPGRERAELAWRRRRALLRSLRGRATPAFGHTKPHTGPLSPGCRLCGQGQWSCLFVNAFCNASCFFCPGLAGHKSVPAYAERIAFPEPDDYVAYVERLRFRGVSFSGGEPFLTLDRLLAHLTALRARFGRDLYIWAYSNGRLATPERLRAVAEAGLDELRLDIAANDYALDAVEAAVGILPRVTVEIPAIPEDRERLQTVLPQLQALGVAHLNLHQLMVVGTNGARLAERGYSFLPGLAPPVLESELCALEVMHFAVESELSLPINYCSVTFKERWQNRVEDLRAAPLVMTGWEALTHAGLVRRVWLDVPAEAAAPLVARLSEAEAGAEPDSGRYRYERANGRLYLHPALLARLAPDLSGVYAQYFKTLVGEAEDAEWEGRGYDYHTVRLTEGKVIGVRLVPVTPPIALSESDAAALAAGETTARVRPFEHIASGLPGFRGA